MIATQEHQSGLVFIEDSHTYKMRGEVIPSVTQMLKKCGLIEDAWFSEQSAIRGSAVHEAIRLYNENTLDWDTLSDEVTPYLLQWIEFCSVHKVETIYSEVRLASPIRKFAGTIDMICLFNGEEMILDFKTMLKPRRPEPWWELQLALYAQLADTCLKINEPLRANLILTPDTYRIAPTVDDVEADAAAYAVLNLMKWRK